MRIAALSQLRSFARYLITGENLYAHLDRAYLYRYLRRCRLKPRSQREYFYSNIGIGLLGNLIEVKLGRTVPDLIVEEICRPLNLTNSVFFLDDDQRRRLAVGHVGNQACWRPARSALSPWDLVEIMRPSAGMYSTLNDLLIFAQASLGQLGHPLEPLLARTLAVQVETPRDIAKLGWMINRFDAGRTILTYKHGMLSGYCAYIGLDTKARVAVAVLCNTFDWDEHIGHNLLLRMGGALRTETTCKGRSPSASRIQRSMSSSELDRWRDSGKPPPTDASNRSCCIGHPTTGCKTQTQTVSDENHTEHTPFSHHWRRFDLGGRDSRRLRLQQI